jgi:hypothetical protein
MTDANPWSVPGARTDPMRLYVLWAQSGSGKADVGHLLARELSRRLDNLGMVRNRVGFSVPVRHRSKPWREGGAPRAIDLTTASFNVIVVVEDDVMRGRHAIWNDYIEGILSAAGRDDLTIPVFTSRGSSLKALASRGIQGIVAPEPPEGQRQALERWLRRLTMYLMGCIWVHQRKMRAKPIGDPRRIGVFISHAKLDGSSVAKLVRKFTNVARPDGDDGIEVPPVNSIELYFDASDTIAASSFSKQFEDYIANGALLAIVTDAYHDRDWCIWEFMKAKEHRSPIVAWDLGHVGTSRRSPYIGNVPEMRLPHVRYRRVADAANASVRRSALTPWSQTDENDATDDRWEIDIETVSDVDVEVLILNILSEALRMAAWTRHAEHVVARSGIVATVVCARPPELVDFAHADRDTAIVYPDPPINQHEDALLRRSRPDIRILPLSEVGR